MNVRLVAICSGTISLAAFSPVASATSCFVPATGLIQDAINDTSRSCSEILLRSGKVYNEHVIIPAGRDITIRGLGTSPAILTEADATAPLITIEADTPSGPGRTVRLENMILKDNDYGGVVANGGSRTTLEIADVTFQNLKRADADGGAVAATVKRLDIDESHFLNNSVTVGDGGAIAVFAASSTFTVDIVGTTFESNAAEAYGGALRIVEGPNGNCEARIIGSDFTGNKVVAGGDAAAVGGGIAANCGVLQLEQSEIAENEVSGDRGYVSGGGLFAKAQTLILKDVIIRLNSLDVLSKPAPYDVAPGGVASIGATSVLIEDSQFLGNTGSRMGGGLGIFDAVDVDIHRSAFNNNLSTDGRGGGVAMSNISGDIEIVQSSFYLNSAFLDGGGIFLHETQDVGIFNTSVLNNEVTHPGAKFRGGGLGFDPGSSSAELFLLHTTFVGNTTSSPSGTNLYAESGQVSVRNSILFDSNWKQSCDVPSLSIVEGLYAQMVDISCHNGASSSARIHKSATLALLGLEQDEDTQRFFRAPSGSPATNNGLSWCPSVDQNGGMRSSVCDLGAIEVHSNLILLPWSQSGGL